MIRGVTVDAISIEEQLPRTGRRISYCSDGSGTIDIRRYLCAQQFDSVKIVRHFNDCYSNQIAGHEPWLVSMRG